MVTIENMATQTQTLAMCKGFGGGIWTPNVAPARKNPGQVVDGKPHGRGTLVQFGVTLKGTFVHGDFTRGVRYDSNDSIKEKGTFVDGNLHGPGCKRTDDDGNDGNIEEGTFDNGDFVYGTRSWNDNCVDKGGFYRGQLKHGTTTNDKNVKEGVCEVTWEDAVRMWGRTIAGKLAQSQPDSKFVTSATAEGAASASAAEESAAEEGAAEGDEEDADEGEQAASDVELKPWQQQWYDDNIVNADGCDRTIHWVYSITGAVGKNFLAKFFEDRHDAITITATDTEAAKDRVYDKMQDTRGRFYEKPIIVVNIPRSDTEAIASKQTYTTLETLRDPTFSVKRGQVTWMDPPVIVVFANEKPQVRKMSPDRLFVQVVIKDNIRTDIELLMVDVETHEECKRWAAELREREAQTRATIEAAQLRLDAAPSFDMKTLFETMYELDREKTYRNSQNKRKSIDLGEQHRKLRAIAEDQYPFRKPAQLREWIRSTYMVVEVDTPHNPSPREGTICFVNPRNFPATIGFRPRA